MAKNRTHDKQKGLQRNPYLDEFGFFTSLYDLHKGKLLDLDKNHQRLLIEATLKVYNKDKDLLTPTEFKAAKDLGLISKESPHTKGANIFSYISKAFFFVTVFGAVTKVADGYSVPNDLGNSVGNSGKDMDGFWAVRSGFNPAMAAIPNMTL